MSNISPLIVNSENLKEFNNSDRNNENTTNYNKISTNRESSIFRNYKADNFMNFTRNS